MVFSMYMSVVRTVSGWAGGPSRSGPNTTSLFGFFLDVLASCRSKYALNPAHSSGLSSVCTWDSHAASRALAPALAVSACTVSSGERATADRGGGFNLEGPL